MVINSSHGDGSLASILLCSNLHRSRAAMTLSNWAFVSLVGSLKGTVSGHPLGLAHDPHLALIPGSIIPSLPTIYRRLKSLICN